MAPIAITDIERAVALLSVEHGTIDTRVAASLIRQAHADNKHTLVSLLASTVPEDALLRGIAKSLGIRYHDLFAPGGEFVFDEEIFNRADVNFLRRFSAIPLQDKTGRVVIAVSNPGDVEMIDYLRSRYRTFALVLSPRNQIQNKLQYYSSSDMALPSLAQLAVAQAQAAQPLTTPTVVATKSPMQEWLDAVLSKAVEIGASDIHFMIQYDKSLLLRMRVDGVLRHQRVPPQIRPIEAIGSLLSRCETIDSANFREPQDGTFSFEALGRGIDARVAMLPQSYGPTVVVRLLDSNNLRTRLDDMGFSVPHLQLMRAGMRQAQGTVLAVGPTGSGKSTTLYALLREANAAEKNILTVENPVEYRLPMIGQTEIRDGLGDRSLTFARALRAILRLDPDIILLGEIRDQETAEVSMQAAITGHLVLSTLHSNSAIGAYPRLSNMGLPGFLVAEALSLVVSQRLLRRVHDCSTLNPPSRDEVVTMQALGLEVPDRVRKVVGCPGCNETGYRGRVAAVEVLAPSRDFKSLVIQHASATELIEQAKADGFTPIQQDGLRHVMEGHTTVAEMMRVLASDEQGT